MILDKNKGLLGLCFRHCFVASFTVLSIACSDSDTVEKFSRNAVVAVVNGSNITINELKDEIQILIKQFRINNKNDLTLEEKLELRMEGLNRAIRNDLLITEVASNNISLSRAEYEEALDNVKGGYQGDFFIKRMEEEGVSPRVWEKSFKNNLLIKKLIKKKFSRRKRV